jgi:adenine deaminase
MLAISIGVFCGSLYGAYIHGRSTATAEIENRQAKQHNQQWSELFTLQGQLATRDLQLAEEQQKKENVRTIKVIKREVIYRDRIKNPDTAKCVADSGLLDLINSAYGMPTDS